MSVTGYIHSMETFGSVDGPGVRFVLFMQGCRMRCKYCHNPDSWKLNTGDEKTPEEILKFALRYRSYWGKQGGITVSGGEPLLQLDFLLEFFKLCKKEGIHTTIDTAAAPFTREEPFFSKFNELMAYTDLLMVDIKDMDPNRHYDLTHVRQDNILDCIRYLDEIGKDIWLRHVLVAGYTDDDAEILQLREFAQSLRHLRKIEVLPYHSFGMYKWQSLGFKYELSDVEPPSPERVNTVLKMLNADKYPDFK